MKYYLGIGSGGTKCAAVLAGADGEKWLENLCIERK